MDRDSVDIVDRLEGQQPAACDVIDFFAAEVVGIVLAGEACPACESEIAKGEEWYSGLTEAVNEAEQRERRNAGLPAAAWRELSVEEKQAFDAKLNELMSKHAAEFIEVAFAGLYHTFGKAVVTAAMQKVIGTHEPVPVEELEA